MTGEITDMLEFISFYFLQNELSLIFKNIIETMKKKQKENLKISKMAKERRENNWVECAYDLIINGEEKKREKMPTFSLSITTLQIYI